MAEIIAIVYFKLKIDILERKARNVADFKVALVACCCNCRHNNRH